jgi:hypothetical protein
LQGLFITFIFIALFFVDAGLREGGLLLLLFPIIHLMSYAPRDIATHTPIIGLIVHAISGYRHIESGVAGLKNTSSSTAFSYDTSTSLPSSKTSPESVIDKL